MHRKLLHLFLLSAAFSVQLLIAADVSGTWSAKVPTRDTTADTTFTFNVEGSKLTGTVEGLKGSQPIAKGEISGDTISFVIEDSERGNQTYKGTISGDEIQFTRTGRRGEPRPFTAKRVK